MPSNRLHRENWLVFYNRRIAATLLFLMMKKAITHVGILLNAGEIIHAAGKVRVDKIDNEGIIDTANGLRTQRLRIIKRYF